MLCILAPSFVKAQNKKATPVRYISHAHGATYQNFPAINGSIAGSGNYKKPNPIIGTLNFGFITERNKSFFKYFLNGGNGFSGNKKTQSTTTKMLGLSVDFGYYVITKKQFAIYPIAGLGYDRYTLVLNKNNSTIPFDSVLQNPVTRQQTSPVKLSNTFLHYRIGAGIKINSVKHPRNSIGFDAGYGSSFTHNDWKINNTQTLAKSPDEKLSKYFAHILISYRLKKNIP